MTAKYYRELIVWQKAMNLVEEIYKLTILLPKEELYGLTSQIRRAAVSVPSNIAEGYGRKSKQEYGRFLNIARGSLAELETQLEICIRLKYIAEEQLSNVLSISTEVNKLLNAIIGKLSSNL